MKRKFSLSNFIFCLLAVLALLVMLGFGLLLIVLAGSLILKLSQQQPHTAAILLKVFVLTAVIGGIVLILAKVFTRWKQSVFFHGVMCPVHQWEDGGCTCRICGTTRDLNHRWNHCTCEKCGAVRKDEHVWNGCVCSICGKQRDETHDWDGCVCRICGKQRDEAHDWDATACVCARCGKEDHDWELINETCSEELPDGISPCLENMCFIETVYTREYRCKKCGTERTTTNSI